MTTGKLIKELRIKKGMTQEELAEKTDLSARTIQRIENGKVDPRAYTLQIIANALEVEFDFLAEIDSEQKKQSEKEEINSWLVLIHLSSLFLLIIPTLIIWNLKKDEVEGLTKHFKDVLQFQLTYLILFLVPGLFMESKLFFLSPGIILGLFMTLLNTLKVLNGKPYKYWLVLSFKEVNGKTKLTFK